MEREISQMKHMFESHQTANLAKFRDLGAKVRAEFIQHAGWNSYGAKMTLRPKFTNDANGFRRIIRPQNDPFAYKVMVKF